MNRPCLKTVLTAGFAVAALMLAAGPSAAIDGGAVAGSNRLSRATVGVGTIVAGSGSIGLSRCSGVLISPSLVLTAGHCVAGNPLAAAVILYEGSRAVRPVIRVASVERYTLPASSLPADYASLRELSLDTAILHLASPVRGRAPIRISRSQRPPAGLRLAGTGLSAEGVGVLKTTHLDPLLVTSSGLIIAQTRGSEVCRGDSGGPVVADGAGGPMLWGVASAVLTSRPPCGRVVLIAPAAPRF